MSDKVSEIQKRLDADPELRARMDKQIEEMKADARLEFPQSLGVIPSYDYTDTNRRFRELEERVDALTREVAELEKEITKMRRRLPRKVK